MFIKSFLLSLTLGLYCSSVLAFGCCNKKKPVDPCCEQMGGVSYCDSSAGRYVCRNGFYSTCYCTRHAVMDLQLLSGCCLWRGGVSPTVNPTGLISCNDGSISEECSLGQPLERIAAW